MSVFFAATLAGAVWAETSTDVLIWDINTKEDGASYDGATRNFDTIKFWAINTQTKQETDLTQYTYIGPEFLLANDAEGLAGSGGEIAGNGTTSAGTYYTDMSAFKEGYTFMAELYLGGTTVDRMLTPLTWSQFMDAVVLGLTQDRLDQFANSLPNPYNMASTMVPEPSSGLLLVIGGALLALRRRRVA
jgi:hypothetical protein